MPYTSGQRELISLVLLYIQEEVTRGGQIKLGPHNIETVYSTHCPSREEQTVSLFIVWGQGL
jgi:hypothetical protein